MNIYEKYGFHKEQLVSIELEGKEGQEKISSCLDKMRQNEITEINGAKLVRKYDYEMSKEVDLVANETKKINLPVSNVLKYVFDDQSWFVVRPSGTEPKMKVYLAVAGSSLEESEKKIVEFKEKVMTLVKSML